MDWILSCAGLTFLLLVGLLLAGAFVDFLATSSPQRVYHGDAFAPEPKPTHVAEFAPDLVAEYDRAA